MLNSKSLMLVSCSMMAFLVGCGGGGNASDNSGTNINHDAGGDIYDAVANDTLTADSGNDAAEDTAVAIDSNTSSNDGGGGDAIVLNDANNDTGSDSTTTVIVDSGNLSDTQNDSAAIIDSNLPVICGENTCQDTTHQAICENDGTKITITACPTDKPACLNGSCVGCISDSDCPSDVAHCQTGTCLNHKCEVKYVFGYDVTCNAAEPALKCMPNSTCGCYADEVKCDPADNKMYACNKTHSGFEFSKMCLVNENQIGCVSEGHGLGRCSHCESGKTANCNLKVNDGCEVNLLTDVNNCGTCGNVCSEGKDCFQGKCQRTVVVPHSDTLNVRDFELDEKNIYYLFGSKIYKTDKYVIEPQLMVENAICTDIKIKDGLIWCSSGGQGGKLVTYSTNDGHLVKDYGHDKIITKSNYYALDSNYIWGVNSGGFIRTEMSTGNQIEYSFNSTSLSEYDNILQNDNYVFIFKTSDIFRLEKSTNNIVQFAKIFSNPQYIITYVVTNDSVYAKYATGYFGDSNYTYQLSQFDMNMNLAASTNAIIPSNTSVSTEYAMPQDLVLYNNKLWANGQRCDKAFASPCGGDAQDIYAFNLTTNQWELKIKLGVWVNNLRVDNSGIYWISFPNQLLAIHNINMQ